MFLIDSIGLSPQSAVTLYIYRVGWTYPARNPVYRSKSIKKTLVVLGLYLDRSVPAGQATVPQPVRPVGANFGCQQTVYKTNFRTHALEIMKNLMRLLTA